MKGWLTVKEAAEKLRFTVSAPANPSDACRKWLRAQGIGFVKRGRVLLVDELDIDAALRKRSA